MKLNASIVSRTVAAKRGASTYAHKVAAHLEPGQTIHFADGSQVRVLSTRTSTDGLRMRVATSDGERNLSARQFVEMGPVSPSMTRLAAFVRRVVAYEAVLDDYIKEAIKAAQLPVDEAMNWSGYLERLYGPLLNSLTKDASLRDDAVRDMVVYELYEKNMLSDGSVHAHFNPDHPNFQGKELKHKVTAYLISLFKYRKSRVADSLRRSLGVGMVGAQGLSRTEGMDILGKDDDSLENGVGDLVRNQNLTVDRTPADISRIEGDDEVSQFLNAYKDYINETQVGSSAKTLNFITDAFASGMSKVEMKDAIVGKPEFQGRNGDPLDAHTYNYLLRKWGEFIRAFAEDPEYGWNESPVARMIAQNAAKEKKLKAPKKVLTTSSLHLAVGVQEKEEIEEELIDQLEKTQLPPAAVKPPSPNVAQQEAVAANPKTPTLQNGVDPDKPKLTIPPEIPGVNHNASVFEEKDMTTIERLMAHERRASMAPKAAASRTPVKFASLRRIAETEPQEVAQALGDLGDSFTRMASQLAALKDNLDLAEAPKEASIRQKVAHRNRYASTLRRLAT